MKGDCIAKIEVLGSDEELKKIALDAIAKFVHKKQGQIPYETKEKIRNGFDGTHYTEIQAYAL